MESNKEKNFASAVVYCHNGSDKITQFLTDLDKSLNNTFFKYEIIVVNDFSSDDSVAKVKEFTSTHKGCVISIINMSIYWGVEAAIDAGINLSIGDFVFEFEYLDADYDWHLMEEVYRKSLTGYDIVNCVRSTKPNLKHRIFYQIFNKYAALRFPISNSTFRVLSRRAINRVHSITQTVPFRKVAYAKCGLLNADYTYTPIKEIKYASDNIITNLLSSFAFFTNYGYKVTRNIAVLLLLIAVVLFVCSLTYDTSWLYVITTILFCSSIIVAVIALVMVYLKLLLNLTFKKKDYLFESIEKLQ